MGAMTGVYVLNNQIIWRGRQSRIISLNEEICSCCCPPFQNPSAMFASHLHAAGLEEMSRSQSSTLGYNPRGEPPCHAWHLASATNAVTRHAF